MSDRKEYEVERNVRSITDTEYKTFQGKNFAVNGIFQGVTDDSTRYVHIQTGERPVGAIVDTASTGAHISRLYEDQGGMDVSGGTVKEPKALNRANNKSLSANLAFNQSPTVTSTGTELFKEVSGGSAGGVGPNDSAPGVTPESEVILAPDTEYLLEIVDTTNDTNPDDIGYGIGFYESKFDF